MNERRLKTWGYEVQDRSGRTLLYVGGYSFPAAARLAKLRQRLLDCYGRGWRTRVCAVLS